MEVRCCGSSVLGGDGRVSLRFDFFCCARVQHASTRCLMLSDTDSAVFSVVDVYNSNTGTWSTAQLSVARNVLAATSVGNVALFSGGYDGSALLLMEGVWFLCCLSRCFKCLHCAFVCPASTCFLMRSTAGGRSSVVDVYNGNTGTWSTAQLSVARSVLAAASVGNLALFTGGLDVTGALLWNDDAWCRWLRFTWCRVFMLCTCVACESLLSHAFYCRCIF
jgi:hypothetical protein